MLTWARASIAVLSLGALCGVAQAAPFCVATAYGESCTYYDANQCRQAAVSAGGACVYRPEAAASAPARQAPDWRQYRITPPDVSGSFQDGYARGQQSQMNDLQIQLMRQELAERARRNERQRLAELAARACETAFEDETSKLDVRKAAEYVFVGAAARIKRDECYAQAGLTPPSDGLQ